MPDKNKVRYGLKNVHIAELIESENGAITYGKPEKYPGAVSLSLDPEGDSNNFNADDTVYFQTTSNNGYSGDLEMAYIPDWFAIKYLNHKKAKSGNVVEMTGGNNKPFALLFEFDGDVNATRHILFNVVANRPSLEGNTAEDSKEPQTSTLSFNASPVECPDGNSTPKSKASKGDSNYETFFTVAPELPEFDEEQIENIGG